jgi:hypothetical protein
MIQPITAAARTRAPSSHHHHAEDELVEEVAGEGDPVGVTVDGAVVCVGDGEGLADGEGLGEADGLGLVDGFGEGDEVGGGLGEADGLGVGGDVGASGETVSVGSVGLEVGAPVGSVGAEKDGSRLGEKFEARLASGPLGFPAHPVARRARIANTAADLSTFKPHHLTLPPERACRTCTADPADL